MFSFLSRAKDPITSLKAAFQTPDLMKEHEEVIIACLRRFGPLGKDGIARHSGLTGNQVARRLKKLQTEGFIELTGNQVLSDSRRKEREWAFVPVQEGLI